MNPVPRCCARTGGGAIFPAPTLQSPLGCDGPAGEGAVPGRAAVAAPFEQGSSHFGLDAGPSPTGACLAVR